MFSQACLLNLIALRDSEVWKSLAGVAVSLERKRRLSLSRWLQVVCGLLCSRRTNTMEVIILGAWMHW